MEMRDKQEVMNYMKERHVLEDNSYTYLELIDQLLLFQRTAAEIVIGKEGAEFVRLGEVISRFESRAREKNLIGDVRVRTGLNALNKARKFIAVSMAGKNGEDRTANVLRYVNREDARFYRNVNVSNGFDMSELDIVAVTKNGFVILEIKNAKEDITIGPDGRILFNNSTCYHDISVGDKMAKKRRLLAEMLEKEFLKEGIKSGVQVDSLIVFSTKKKERIHVNDQYRKERFCFNGGIPKRIDEYDSPIEYTNEEMTQIYEIFSELESKQKRFHTEFEPQEILQSFADAYEALFIETGEKKHAEVIVDERGKEESNRNTDKRKEVTRVIGSHTRITNVARFVASYAAVMTAIIAMSTIGSRNAT